MAETYFEGARWIYQKISEQKFSHIRDGIAIYAIVNPEYMTWLEQRVKTLEAESAGLELMLMEDPDGR